MTHLAPRRFNLDVDFLSRKELISYVGELEGQIEALLAASFENKLSRLQVAFGLTQAESRLLGLLADGKPRSKQALMNGIYWDQVDVDWPEIKIIDVWVCKMRRKLEGSSLKVMTHWGTGYSLQGADELERILAGEAPRSDPDMGDDDRRRKAGDVRQTAGYARDAAMSFFADHADKAGLVSFTIRELGNSLRPYHSGGASFVRVLEARGFIQVVKSSRETDDGKWLVKVLTEPASQKKAA